MSIYQALSGNWVNSYGSTMALTVSLDGSIEGDYASTTGSTGKYKIVGQCSTHPAKEGEGCPLVLCICWRSIGGDDYDASWHWMSTYCGQLLPTGELNVMNSLIATSDFGGVGQGDYIDKLSFQKVQNDKDVVPSTKSKRNNMVEIANPINGLWVGTVPSVSLSLSVKNHHYGIVQGYLIYQQETVLVWGFTDTNTLNMQRQSISICGYLKKKNTPISISGWLDLENKRFCLSRWAAKSTNDQNRYYQANVENWQLESVDNTNIKG